MYHAYKCTLVILCLSLFEVFNLVFPDRLTDYFLLIIMQKYWYKLALKIKLSILCDSYNQVHHFAQIFW